MMDASSIPLSHVLTSKEAFALDRSQHYPETFEPEPTCVNMRDAGNRTAKCSCRCLKERHKVAHPCDPNAQAAWGRVASLEAPEQAERVGKMQGVVNIVDCLC